MRIEPENSSGYYYLGIALAGRERYNDAIRAFDRSIALDPSNAPAFYFKGVALIRTRTVR